MIGIVDYGAGNLHSVANALHKLGHSFFLVSCLDDFVKADKIILPGVGNFDDAIVNLRKKQLFNPIKDWLAQDRAFLGICVGLQMLFQKSEESPNQKGLAYFSGTNERFTMGSVPQIGWNRVRFVKKDKIFEGITDESYFYFLHSYYPKPKNQSYTLAKTNYYIDFSSAFKRGNVYAVQFHPEKSSTDGLRLLNNWVNL